MKQETFRKQAPVALLAIMQHAVDHNLSAPFSIDVSPGDSSIRIRLMGAEHEAWMSTLNVLEENNEDHDRVGWVRTAWVVQLPATGVVFDIVSFREAPAPMLSVVSA